VLRKCVHCGFFTATCPTCQLLGDELDGPRARIQLIKQVLEGGEVRGFRMQSFGCELVAVVGRHA
jgi:Fe-S oxidoreductase